MTIELDALDRKICHALDVDGRAPFTVLAGALGVSDQTIARRYRRLRSSGALRVVGLTDARRLGHVDWVVRLQCVPGAAEPIAAALAERTDTSWVSLTSGGTEIVYFTRTEEATGGTRIAGSVRRGSRVLAVSAHCLLRSYAGGALGWVGRADALTADEHRRVPRPPRPDGTADPGQPDIGDDDAPLIAALARDGRASYRGLAAATGWSESTAARRIEHLRRTGALFFDVEIDARTFGYTCQAMLWLAVPPARLTEVGATLAGHPEVAFAAATTGTTNLVATLACADVDALYHYLATRLGALDAITHAETAPVIGMLKRAGAVPPR